MKTDGSTTPLQQPVNGEMWINYRGGVAKETRHGNNLFICYFGCRNRINPYFQPPGVLIFDTWAVAER